VKKLSLTNEFNDPRDLTEFLKSINDSQIDELTLSFQGKIETLIIALRIKNFNI